MGASFDFAYVVISMIIDIKVKILMICLNFLSISIFLDS